MVDNITCMNVFLQVLSHASQLRWHNSLAPNCALPFHTPCEPSSSTSYLKSFLTCSSSVGPRLVMHEVWVIHTLLRSSAGITKEFAGRTWSSWAVGLPGRWVEPVKILFRLVGFKLTLPAYCHLMLTSSAFVVLTEQKGLTRCSLVSFRIFSFCCPSVSMCIILYHWWPNQYYW
jgi:hypothetical protein